MGKDRPKKTINRKNKIMSLQSLFPIITSTTIAITTTILGCTIAQAVTINGGQKLQAVSTLAYSENLFFLAGFAENNSSGLNSSNVTFTPEALTFNSSTQLGDLLLTSTYNSTYDSNSDTVTWSQLGVLGSQSWSSSGTVIFLDDNETIVWNSNGSINPNWRLEFGLQWNGEGWTSSIFGSISDNLGEYGSYNAGAGIVYDGDFWKGSVQGTYSKIIDPVELTITGAATYTSTGDTTGSITSSITPVPEPLTILGSGLGLGFGAFFKKEYSKKQKKVKSLEKQKA
jgi:hypothetical protein